jgi:hypothetical protein
LGTWDYVVLQCQSQEPSLDSLTVDATVMIYAHKLDSVIHAADSCAETVFYMTWGRKNGDTSNCAAYPPVCTYAGMQERLRKSYLLMGQQNNASVAPVGCVWRELRNQNPVFDLYMSDESHPSIYGSYLAATVFYNMFFQRAALGSSFYSTLSQNDANLIQQTAFNFFSDSLALFAQNGNIPFASYSSLVNAGTSQFTNTSLNAVTYSWDFGDGNFSLAQNPNHIYAATGNYIVNLTSSNNCFSDVFSDTVSISSVGVNEMESTSKITVSTLNKSIYISSETFAADCDISIYDISGKKVFSEKCGIKNKKTLEVPQLSGVYFLRLETKEQTIMRKIILED